MATLTIADLDNGKRDLETVDAVANSQADTTTTRYGQQTLTLAGALRRLGYSAPVPYASGLTVDTALFTVLRDGVIYAPDPSLVPFTTGTWNAAQWRVVQNTVDSNLVHQFLTIGAAQSAAATLPEGSTILVDGISQGLVSSGEYVPKSDAPAKVFWDYAEMEAYSGSASLFQIKKSGIAGFFAVVAGDTSTPRDGGVWFVLADGRRVRRIFEGPLISDWFEVVGDGAVDDSANAQKAIDAAKGKKLVFPGGKQYLMAGVTMIGASYNNTEVVFDGELKLKPAPTTSSETYEGAWLGLLVKDCDNATVHMRGNGNRANQPNFEHVHIMGVAGATNLKVPYFYGREVRGDGLYVGASKWRESSLNTSGVTIGTIEVVNSSNDGRNGLSIISADNVSVDSFRSHGVGATVGGFVQPGGLDIEPNHAWESCKNIAIGMVNVVTAGTSGLAVLGRSGADVTRNVTVGSAVVVNTSVPTVADANAAITQTNNHTLVVSNATAVTIGEYRGSFLNAYGDAVVVSNSSDVKINGSVRHVREGLRCGLDVDDAAGQGVIASTINLDITDIARFGVRAGKISLTDITGKCTYPTQSYYPGGVFGVTSATYTQAYSSYGVSVRHDDNWTRTYRQEPGTPASFVQVSIRNCDCSGTWSAPQYVNRVGDMPVPRHNVLGVTDQRTVPQGTTIWAAGQYVRNNAPAAGQPKGWYYAGGAWVSEGNL